MTTSSPHAGDTPAKPSVLSWVWYGLARLYMLITGWRVPGRLPDDPKYIIVATHTSNWDLLVALVGMAFLSKGFRGFYFAWMGTKELFWGIQGFVFRRIGGISIDRSASHDMVSTMVDEFNRHERMVLIITPEGTRKGVRRWKMGFYHIAKGAGVPILCGFLDYRHKVVGPGMLVYPTDDIVADLCRIREFYYGMPARYPDQVGEPWVPGMEACPPPDGGYRAWLRANSAWVGVSGGE